MRILQISNFDYKKNFHQFYNCDYKLYFGLIKNGHSVYQFSNRDLARQEGLLKSRTGSKGVINKKLLKVVNELKPELILVGHADNISNATLKEIKGKHKDIKIIGFYVDALWIDKNVEYLKERAKILDALFITTAGESLEQFREYCEKVSFIPNPVDNSVEIYRQFEKDKTEFDVFFAGGGDYRTKTMQGLKTKLPKIKFNILGQSEEAPLHYGDSYLQELAKCKIGVNLPQFTDDKYQPYLYSSDRIAQYFGNGLATIIHEKTGYKDLFDEDIEAVFYSEFDELIEKLQQLYNDDDKRKNIAKNGFTKYHMLYNSIIATQYMVEVSFDRKYSLNYFWPVI